MVAVLFHPRLVTPQCPTIRSKLSVGEAKVIVDRPTKPLALPHLAALAADLLDGYHEPIPETLEFPLPLIVREVRESGTPQRSLPVDDRPVQGFSDRAHESLREGVYIERSRR
jgi:hypothetical protein